MAQIGAKGADAGFSIYAPLSKIEKMKGAPTRIVSDTIPLVTA